MLTNILEKLNTAKSVVILTHRHPDGDAISSCLALKIILGDKADVIIPSYPESFSFLPHINVIKKQSNKNYDLAVALDCADAKRLVGYEQYFKNAKVSIAIDHHLTNEYFADYNFVDYTSPACAQILAEIFKERVDVEVAWCLLTGIISDTSALTERNITSKTFEAVRFLTEKGADYKEICTNVIYRCTKDQFRLKQLIVSRVQIIANTAISYLTIDDTKNGVVDHKYLLKEYQHIVGVDVIILLLEYPTGIKVSLRATNVDVLRICKKFGGGGHKNSAGCVIEGSLEEVKTKILKEII